MRLFSPSTWFFIGYRTFPWSLSSKNPRSKPSQVNQSIKCSHLKDDGGAHTWLATVDLNESPQFPEKSDSFSYFSIVFCIFFKRQKNHNSCLSLLMRFVNRLSWQNCLLWHKTAFHSKLKKIVSHGIQNLSLFLKYMCNGKLEKKFDFLSTCEGESPDHHFKFQVE